MKLQSPEIYMLVGFVLVVLGLVFPLLMVMQMIKSTFIVNFLSYAASIGGLFLGFMGAALYIKGNRSR
jgi:hypothetical protein